MCSTNINYEILSRLVAAGADPNARDHRGRSPLFGLVDSLFKNMADAAVRALDKILDQKLGFRLDAVDFHGRNMLFACLKQGNRANTNMLKHLVSRGLDASATDFAGNTLWLEAIQEHQGTVAEHFALLLELGVDPKQANNAGRIGLHLLCALHRMPIDLAFSIFKDVVDEKDNDGDHLLHITMRSSHQYLKKELLARGANLMEQTTWRCHIN